MDLNSGVELKLIFVPGRKILYSLETQLEQRVQQNGQVMQENDTTFQAHLRQSVIASEADGSGHVVTHASSPTPAPNETPQVTYQKLSPRGAVLDVSGMNPTNSFALPEEKVKADSSWVGEIVLPLPQSTQPVRCATEYSVAGTASFNGLECIKIDCHVEEFEFDMPLPNNQGRAKVLMGSQGSMLFAPKEGILARMEVETVTSPHVGGVIFTTSTMITQEFRGFEN